MYRYLSAVPPLLPLKKIGFGLGLQTLTSGGSKEDKKRKAKKSKARKDSRVKEKRLAVQFPLYPPDTPDKRSGRHAENRVFFRSNTASLSLDEDVRMTAYSCLPQLRALYLHPYARGAYDRRRTIPGPLRLPGMNVTLVSPASNSHHASLLNSQGRKPK